MALPIKVDLAEGVTLYCADFIEILPDGVGRIDHMITDPPYEQKNHDSWVETKRPDGSLLKTTEVPFAGVDVIRHDILIRAKMRVDGWFLAFCSTEGVAAWRDAIESFRLKYKAPLIWVKPDCAPKFNGQGPVRGHECLVSAWCGAGHSRWNGGGKRGVFTHYCNSRRDGRHPTEKPVSLMTELVTLFSDPGDLICDPFMGSGATGIACLRAGRSFIGIEKNRKYFDAACERMERTLKQGDFFVPMPKPKQEKFQWSI